MSFQKSRTLGRGSLFSNFSYMIALPNGRPNFIGRKDEGPTKERMMMSCYPFPIGSMYGIFPYIYHKFMPNVGKYPSPMDPMGVLIKADHGNRSTSRVHIHIKSPTRNQLVATWTLYCQTAFFLFSNQSSF